MGRKKEVDHCAVKRKIRKRFRNKIGISFYFKEILINLKRLVEEEFIKYLELIQYFRLYDLKNEKEIKEEK